MNQPAKKPQRTKDQIRLLRAHCVVLATSSEDVCVKELAAQVNITGGYFTDLLLDAGVKRIFVTADELEIIRKRRSAKKP